jgi:two-component system, LytTR family, sensor kinase
MTESRSPWVAPAAPRWFWIAAIWLAIGLSDAAQNIVVMQAQGMRHDWLRVFAALLLSWLPWALATGVVLRLGRRYPLVPWPPAANWLRHLAAWVAVGVVSAAWTAGLEALFDPWGMASPPSPLAGLLLAKFSDGLFSFVILYAAIIVVGHGLDSRDRLAFQQAETARLGEQLAKAQLSALRRQIEPHFVFNALNAVAGLIRENRSEAAIGMLAGVSDFLRRALDVSDRQLVSLGEEMEFLQRYLDIQKIRFGERLQVGVDVPDPLKSAQVPSLILQPMVENAFKHGLAKRARGGAIRVTASRAGAMLTLSVYNDGPGLVEDPARLPAGVGIANVRERLRSLYGDRFVLALRNRDGGVEASLAVPFELG